VGEFLRSLPVVTSKICVKRAFLDLHLVATKRFERIRFAMGIGLGELRHEVVEQPEKVIEDQDLTATNWAQPRFQFMSQSAWPRRLKMGS
jgi:hypothetical protein